MLTLRRWFPSEYALDEATTLVFETKRLLFHEAAPLLVSVANATEPFSGMDAETATFREKRLAILEYCRRLPEDRVREAFRVGVRNPKVRINATGEVQDLADEDGVIATGERLYDVADETLVTMVLTRLRTLSTLTEAEGKVSSSPSTSARQERGTDAGPWAAPATESADGTSPSTATATPSEPVLSSGPE